MVVYLSTVMLHQPVPILVLIRMMIILQSGQPMLKRIERLLPAFALALDQVLDVLPERNVGNFLQ